MKTVNAIKRAQTEHVQGGAAINALRLACLQLLEANDNPKRAQMGGEVEQIRAALKGVPEQRVDWEHHNALRDAMVHAAAVGTYPDVVASLRAMVVAWDEPTKSIRDGAIANAEQLLKVIDADGPPPALMPVPPAIANLDAIDEDLNGANEGSPDA